jgi:hypothetical protein
MDNRFGGESLAWVHPFWLGISIGCPDNKQPIGSAMKLDSCIFILLQAVVCHHNFDDYEIYGIFSTNHIYVLFPELNDLCIKHFEICMKKRLQ